MKDKYKITEAKPLTVHDLPLSERPREKLIAGIASDADLIAILLRTGSHGESVITTSQKLISKYGSLSALAEASIEDLTDFKGVGPAKAIQLKAAFKIASKIKSEMANAEKEKKQSRAIISPEEAVELVRSKISDYNKEHFLVVSFDTRQKVIGIDSSSQGTLTASIVHPRETFEWAIKRHAASILAAHNHPSGDPEPSEEDIRITKRLTEAGKIIGIELLDHIIVTRSSFFSFKEKGMI